MSKDQHPDVNDTLRSHGIDAVRERHDRAHDGQARRTVGQRRQQQPPSSAAAADRPDGGGAQICRTLLPA